MDVRKRFKKENKQYDNRTCTIVIDFIGITIGLIVDRVSEVLTIPEQDVVPLPEVDKNVKQKYINGIGKVENDVKLLLDCEKLLNEDEAEQLCGIKCN